MLAALVEPKPASARSQPVRLVTGGVNHARGKSAPGSVCRLNRTFLPSALSEDDLVSLSTITLSKRRFEALFRSGDALDAIYLVRVGYVKTVVLSSDGREQVTGFCMPGDVLGVDAVSTGRYVANAIALEDCEVCVIRYTELEMLSSNVQPLQSLLYRMFSREIVRKQEMMFLLGSMRVDERLATFLVNLSNRFASRGFSPSDFIMRMTREEIGSFLGMKLETVSRVFSKLHREGILDIDRKHVRITDIDRLKSITGD